MHPALILVASSTGNRLVIVMIHFINLRTEHCHLNQFIPTCGRAPREPEWISQIVSFSRHSNNFNHASLGGLAQGLDWDCTPPSGDCLGRTSAPASLATWRPAVPAAALPPSSATPPSLSRRDCCAPPGLGARAPRWGGGGRGRGEDPVDQPTLSRMALVDFRLPQTQESMVK